MTQQQQDLPDPETGAEGTAMNRRRALRRLGLLAGSAYLAPTLMTLQDAIAQDNGLGGNDYGPGDTGTSAAKKKKSKPSKSKK